MNITRTEVAETARAGKEGVSLVLATVADVKTLRNYETHTWD